MLLLIQEKTRQLFAPNISSEMSSLYVIFTYNIVYFYSRIISMILEIIILVFSASVLPVARVNIIVIHISLALLTLRTSDVCSMTVATSYRGCTCASTSCYDLSLTQSHIHTQVSSLFCSNFE